MGVVNKNVVVDLFDFHLNRKLEELFEAATYVFNECVEYFQNDSSFVEKTKVKRSEILSEYITKEVLPDNEWLNEFPRYIIEDAIKNFNNFLSKKIKKRKLEQVKIRDEDKMEEQIIYVRGEDLIDLWNYETIFEVDQIVKVTKTKDWRFICSFELQNSVVVYLDIDKNFMVLQTEEKVFAWGTNQLNELKQPLARALNRRFARKKNNSLNEIYKKIVHIQQAAVEFLEKNFDNILIYRDSVPDDNFIYDDFVDTLVTTCDKSVHFI